MSDIDVSAPVPSDSALSRLRDRATTQRNVTIYVAILVAVPAAYGFHVWTGASVGDFYLLMLLAVGVPTAYDEHREPYDETRRAVAWILGACAVTTVEFTGLFLLASDAFALSDFWASTAAFAATTTVNAAWLVVTGE